MKNRNKLLLPLLCGMIGIACHSQGILWEKSYGGKHADYLTDVQATADYGFILAGSSLSNRSGNKTDDNKGDLDYWVWKMNEKGDLDWQKSFGGSGNDFLQSIALTNDGGFILGGTSNSNIGFDKKSDSIGQEDYWLIKLNAAGLIEWQKTYGGESLDDLKKIIVTKDGGYLVGGVSSSNKSGDKSMNGYGSLDYWIIKLDSKGVVEWQKVYGGDYLDDFRNLEQTNDGGYILGGYSNSIASGNKTDDSIGVGDYWIIKIDIKGEIEWQKTLGGNLDDQLSIVHQTIDKGYIIGGSSNSESSYNKIESNVNGTDFWIVKLDEKGENVWQKTYNYGNVDILNSLIENNDGSIIIGGFAQSELQGSKKSNRVTDKEGIDDFILLKIDKNGEELWSKTVGSKGDDYLKKIIETRDGGYLLTGSSNSQLVYTNLVNEEKKNAQGIKDLGLENSENKQFETAKNEVNNSIQEVTNSINKTVSDETSNAIDYAKKEIGLVDNSPFKFGASGFDNVIGAPSLGNNAEGTEKNKNSTPSEKKLPVSRDKTENFGNYDFWVVKIKDKSKPEVVKATIEALPNPTLGFTNIIVGYEYQTGTATLVDLAGRQLKQFSISGRTIPIDLSQYPEGIYVVNIKTNIQSDGVKVIKGNNKN